MVTQKENLKIMFWRTDYYGAITEGGVASLHLGLINGFRKMGHTCSYVSSGRMILPEDVNYHFIPHNKLLKNFPEVLNLPYNNRSFAQLKKIIEIEKPDFILQHNHDFNYGGALVRRKLGIPLLLHCDGVEYWIKKNWGKLYFGKLLKWAEEMQWDAADAIFVPSANVKKQMVELGVNGAKIVINPNAVDPDIFSPDLSGIDIRNQYKIKNKFICGFVGTFGRWHGVDYLAESVKYIKEKLPDAFILFVGDGELRPKIEEILDKHDPKRENSLVTGLVPYKEVPKYMAACDVLLTPCVGNEEGTDFFNSPIKLFEYMAMKKPVIATDIGQQGEIFRHNENGILIDERNPAQIFEAIQLLHDNNELAERISETAREEVLEKYDWRVNCNRFIDAYDKTINQ